MESPFVCFPSVNSTSPCQTGMSQQDATEKNTKLKFRVGLEALYTAKLKKSAQWYYFMKHTEPSPFKFS